MAQVIELIDPCLTYPPQVIDAELNTNGAFGPVIATAYSPSGTFFATATFRGAVQVVLWDMLTGSLALAFPTVNVIGKIVSMVWEESKILMGISTGKIYIFDCSNGAMSEEDFERSGEELVSFLCFPAKQMRLAIFKSGLLITEKGKMIRMQGSRITEEDLIITSATIHESGALFITSQKGDGLLIFDLNSDRELLIDGITSIGTNVQNISVNYDGNLIALILKDKSIRIIDCNMNFGTESAQVRPRHKLQDVVNRWSWSRAGFSHDGELIWGTFASKDKHQIYIWDAKSGALVKVLEGPKEVLVMAAWNPKRPNIITCGAFGTLFRWVPDYPLKWSPLVPGLEEIEENVIYEEREDEFDFTMEEENSFITQSKEREKPDETAFIDVTSCDPFAPIVELVKIEINPDKSSLN